jgi:hypothetical protein
MCAVARLLEELYGARPGSSVAAGREVFTEIVAAIRLSRVTSLLEERNGTNCVFPESQDTVPQSLSDLDARIKVTSLAASLEYAGALLLEYAGLDLLGAGHNGAAQEKECQNHCNGGMSHDVLLC